MKFCLHLAGITYVGNAYSRAEKEGVHPVIKIETPMSAETEDGAKGKRPKRKTGKRKRRRPKNLADEEGENEFSPDEIKIEPYDIGAVYDDENGGDGRTPNVVIPLPYRGKGAGKTTAGVDGNLTEEDYMKIEMPFAGEGPISHSLMIANLGLGPAVRDNTGKPWKCDMCDFHTKRKSYLLDHQRTHFDEKPFKCGIDGCEYETRFKNHLRRHQLIHTTDIVYKCDLDTCPFETRRRDSYVKHMKTIHGGARFKCDFCEFETKRKSYLLEHARTHFDEKPFKCDSCDYRLVHGY